MIQTKITAPLAKSSAKDTVKATATNTSSVQTTKTAEKKETKNNTNCIWSRIQIWTLIRRN